MSRRRLRKSANADDPAARVDAARRVKARAIARKAGAPLPALTDVRTPETLPVQTAPMLSAPAALPPASSDPITAANARAAEMAGIGVFAAKRGVAFDLPTALASGMTTRQARAQVMEAGAAADENLVTNSTPSIPSAAASSTAEFWAIATARAAKRAGLDTRGAGR